MSHNSSSPQKGTACSSSPSRVKQNSSSPSHGRRGLLVSGHHDNYDDDAASSAFSHGSSSAWAPRGTKPRRAFGSTTILPSVSPFQQQQQSPSRSERGAVASLSPSASNYATTNTLYGSYTTYYDGGREGGEAPNAYPYQPKASGRVASGAGDIHHGDANDGEEEDGDDEVTSSAAMRRLRRRNDAKLSMIYDTSSSSPFGARRSQHPPQTNDDAKEKGGDADSGGGVGTRTSAARTSVSFASSSAAVKKNSSGISNVSSSPNNKEGGGGGGSIKSGGPSDASTRLSALKSRLAVAEAKALALCVEDHQRRAGVIQTRGIGGLGIGGGGGGGNGVVVAAHPHPHRSHNRDDNPSDDDGGGGGGGGGRAFATAYSLRGGGRETILPRTTASCGGVVGSYGASAAAALNASPSLSSSPMSHQQKQQKGVLTIMNADAEENGVFPTTITNAKTTMDASYNIGANATTTVTKATAEKKRRSFITMGESGGDGAERDYRGKGQQQQQQQAPSQQQLQEDLASLRTLVAEKVKRMQKKADRRTSLAEVAKVEAAINQGYKEGRRVK